jgi:predicted outer membrane repeat protein
MGNKGGAIYAFGSKVIMSGSHNITNNSGTRHGGGLSLQFWSRAIFTEVDVIVFANNNASVSGGAIYADSTSSSETYVDLLNAVSGVGPRKKCFLTLDDGTRVDYDDSSPQGKVYRSSLLPIYPTFRLCLMFVCLRLSSMPPIMPSCGI